MVQPGHSGPEVKSDYDGPHDNNTSLVVERRTTANPRSAGIANLIAGGVTALSFFVLQAGFDPVPAGESIAFGEENQSAADFVLDVPVPPEARGLIDQPTLPADTELNEVAPDSALNAEADQAGPAEAIAPHCVLNNREAIRFSLLLLEDGARFLENTPGYSAVFNKQERVDGDLSDDQRIEIKVRHEPQFSVYMKWKTGDRGRQVLFSEGSNDDHMLVKLGGLKGRLLPSIKLDPHGERAMSESRHPVTKAGLLGMLGDMIDHRRRDLEQDQGVVCRRFPNQDFNGRDCYCFLFEYNNPEQSETYRKSLVLIDSRYNIPLMVRNHTWAIDAEGLTDVELDERTLIENYSFSEINFAVELADGDFSRENPAYRM